MENIQLEQRDYSFLSKKHKENDIQMNFTSHIEANQAQSI